MSDKIYITPNGASGLRSELKYLWKEKRPEVTQKVSAAAALGDRSENADYIYGKKQLREKFVGFSTYNLLTITKGNSVDSFHLWKRRFLGSLQCWFNLRATKPVLIYGRIFRRFFF